MTNGIRRWARLAVIGNIVFVFAWLLAASWQGSHYSVLAHSISDMYANGAPAAAFLIVLFTLSGVTVVLFALRSLWPVLRDAGRPARVGVILLALSIFGLGDVLSPFEREGCRLADTGCTATAQTATFGGWLDATLSTAGIVALAVAGFFLAAAMSRLPAWRSWARPTRWATIAFLALCVLDGILGSSAGLGGLGERLIALAGAVGITALAIGVLRRTTSSIPADADTNTDTDANAVA